MPSCGDEVASGSTYYCEWNCMNGTWDLVNTALPNASTYYCPMPSALSGSGMEGETHYFHPCPLTSSSSSRAPYSQGTYRLWNGNFNLVGARSQNGGASPGNLIRYSTSNPAFSFVAAFEFSTKPYVRGTYKFRDGKFVPLEGCSEDGTWPVDPIAYSKENKDFSYLVTLEFTGRGKRPARSAKKSSRPAKKKSRR